VAKLPITMAIKKTKALLVLGDKKDFDTYQKFISQKRFFSRSAIAVKNIDYFSLLDNKFPFIATDNIIIFPCFPFEYWDKYIEPKDYKGVYGNKEFYIKFKMFWKTIDRVIQKAYGNKRISYINHPEHLAKDRDKELTKELVSRAGVLVPKSFSVRKMDDIFSLLEKGFKLFIKVRYGSMGKGITYLEKGRWLTKISGLRTIRYSAGNQIMAGNLLILLIKNPSCANCLSRTSLLRKQ